MSKKGCIKRTMCLCTIFIILLSLCAPAYADDSSHSSTPSRVEGLFNTIIDLNIDSRGLADCFAKITLQSGYSADATLTLLQKNPNSGVWTEVDTWSSNSTNVTLRISETKYVMSGNSYALQLNADIYNSSGKLVDSISKLSDIISY